LAYVGNQPFPPHPYFAFVNLRIGNFDFTPIPPEHLISFEFTDTSDVESRGVGEGSFTVFDETALRIEHALWSAASTQGGIIMCYFNFGYVESPHISHTYSFIIKDYDLTMKASGAELNIKMVGKGMVLHGLPVALAYNTGEGGERDGMTLEEIIRDVFEYLDCEIDEIEDLEDIIVRGDDNNGNEIEKYVEVRFDNIPATHGMINKVLAICRAEDSNETSQVLTFIDEGEGAVRVNVTSYGYNAANNEPVKEYSIPWDGELGEVISFSVEFNAAAMLTGGSEVDIDTIDGEYMDYITHEHNSNTNPNKYLIGGKETHIEDDDARTIPNYSSGIYDILNRKAEYLWHKSRQSDNLGYKANMEILGDPYLKTFDTIIVIVRTPMGIPHHTSGLYTIQEITHSISGGSWKTSLKLFRDPLEGIDEIEGRLIGGYEGTRTGEAIEQIPDEEPPSWDDLF